MHFTNYENYNIDAADIWLHERNMYAMGSRESQDKKCMLDLYEFLPQFFLQAKHPPFIGASDEDNNAKSYREKYDRRTEEHVYFDFFFHQGKGYDMAQYCEVKLDINNQLEFQRLFILKLRQYSDGLIHLQGFLKYQLKNNFKNTLNDFQNFLKLSLLQYPETIAGSISRLIDEWLIETHHQKEQNSIKKNAAKLHQRKVKGDSQIEQSSVTANENQETLLISTVASSNMKTEPVTETQTVQEILLDKKSEPSVKEGLPPNYTEPATLPSTNLDTLPDGYKLIPGNFTNEEIQQFFSFLFMEKSEDGEPFLPEDKVKEIFRHGLALPPIPLTKKLKLNCSLKFPKSIVEHCIYKFFQKHTSNKQKKEVLRFFAHYLQDFERALESEKAMQTWSDNIRGNRPSRMNFSLQEYLPQRLS